MIDSKREFDLKFMQAFGVSYKECHDAAKRHVLLLVSRLQPGITTLCPLTGPVGVIAGYMLEADDRFHVEWSSGDATGTVLYVRLDMQKILRLL